MAAEFGVTAWGRAWLRTVERVVAKPIPGLSAARSLARNNAVVFTDISAGNIAAKVTAKGAVSSVKIVVPLWNAKQFDSVTRALQRAGTTSQSVSTGELPDSVVPALSSIGIGVAPDLSDCAATCDCTGKRVPCVHHLATIYALANKLDEEPALAMTLRSKPRKTRAAASTPALVGWILLREIDASTFYGD